MAHLVCLLNVDSDRATLTWSEGPASFEPYELEGLVYREFKEICQNAREKLANLIKDYLYSKENVPQSSYELAEAGHEVYLALFDPDADQRRQARQVKKWLERLGEEHEVDTLELVVESPWSLPWNVIYDQAPDEDAFLENDDSSERWMPFWGLRYNLAGGRKVDPLRRMPMLSKPDVLMVLDREIVDGLPDDQRERLTSFIKRHDLKVVEDKDALKKATRRNRPDILYWMSHAEPDALILNNDPVTPRDLRKLLKNYDDEDLGFGGIAFLNACQTAEGAGEEGSFFEAFHSVGFAGMIGTEHQTIDQFANPLGLDFLETFLTQGTPIGEIMRSLRARVPLGLLYGLYCPPNLRVETGLTEHEFDVRQMAHIAGRALGSQFEPAPEGEVTAVSPRYPSTMPLPEEPYKSLDYYVHDDRALFAGRDDDVQRFSQLLDDGRTKLLVLHGESGIGKSSFLRAGLIPFLEDECVGYQFVRNRSVSTLSDDETDSSSVMFIRATNDLFGQLAQSICEFCEQPYEYPTPTGETVTVDLPAILSDEIGALVNPFTVRAVMCSDLDAFGRILNRISHFLPFDPILIIDQGEEIFTLAQTPEERERSRNSLNMLRRMIGALTSFKVIFSLRTEYYGRLIDRLRTGVSDTSNIREYLLTDFEEADLIEAVRRPTLSERIPHTDEIPFQKYGFRYDDGVAEEIARRVLHFTSLRRDSVLPLLQVICAQVARIARERDGVATLEDLDHLGGIEGGMRSHVDGLFEQFLANRPLERRAIRRLFTQLYLRQPDGTLTTALIPEENLEESWKGKTPFDQLVMTSRSLRLLRVKSLRIGMEMEQRYISLGHDALAKIAAEWDDAIMKSSRVRKLAAMFGAVSVVAIAMVFLSIFAWSAKAEAERQSEDAERQRATAQARREDAEGQRKEAENQRAKAVLLADLAERNAKVAKQERKHALGQHRIALSRQLATQARSHLASNPTLSQLLAVQSVQVLNDDDPRVIESENGLREILSQTGGIPLREADGVGEVEFGPHMKWIAGSSSRDGKVRLWSLSNPSAAPILLTDSTGKAAVGGCAFDPNGEQLAAAKAEASINVWDLRTLRTVAETQEQEIAEPLTLPGISKPFLELAFTPDGRLLAKYGDPHRDQSIRIWNLRPEPKLAPSEITSEWEIHLDPTGRFATHWAYESSSAGTPDSPSNRGHLLFWDLTGAEPESVAIGHRQVSTAPVVRFAANGQWMATDEDETQTMLLWDLTAKPKFKPLPERLNSSFMLEAIGPNGRWLASRDMHETLRLWDLLPPSFVIKPSEQEALILSFGSTHQRTDRRSDPDGNVQFDPQGQWLAAWGQADRTVRLWKLKSPKDPPRILRGHAKDVSSLSFSKDGNWLATISERDKSVRLWNLKSPMVEPAALMDGQFMIQATAAPAQRLVAEGELGQITVRDASDESKPMRVFRSEVLGHELLRAKLSDSGKWLMGFGNGVGALWDLASKKSQPVLLLSRGSLQGTVEDVAFDPSDHWMASTRDVPGAAIKQALLWNLRSLQDPPVELNRDAEQITLVQFSSTGELIAVGTQAGTVRVWNTAELWSKPQTESAILPGAREPIDQIAFDEDRKRLLAGSKTGQLFAWELDIAPLLQKAVQSAGRKLTDEETRQFIGQQ